MVVSYELPTFECKRCGHTWHPRNPEKPRCCARCKTPYWDVPSVAEKKCSQAIDDAFSAEGVAAFLEALDVRGVKISNLEETSSNLTEHLSGGAFSRGDTFDTRFLTLYLSLGNVEQNRVKELYQSRIKGIPGALKKRFAKVFRK